MMSRKSIILVLCIGICMSFAYAGSIFTPEQGTWYYTTLVRPSWNPPDWLFPPVWTVLFILMGISLSMIVQAGLGRKDVRIAVSVFAIQLMLNLGWSASFFGLRSPYAGFVDIIVLWLFIVASILTFRKISPLSGYLLIPYLLWVSFAAFLNFTILQLNP
jgi:tryptophan-rich sensory protein